MLGSMDGWSGSLRLTVAGEIGEGIRGNPCFLGSKKSMISGFNIRLIIIIFINPIW